MLQAFICYCSSSDVYDVRVCARACVLFIGIVQRNWACLTWKSAIEIKSLLLLLLLNVSVPQGRISLKNCKCWHTETAVAEQTCSLTQSQYNDTRQTSPSTDPIMPDAWQGSQQWTNFKKSQVWPDRRKQASIPLPSAPEMDPIPQGHKEV